jgi:hypothetical protein
VTAVEFMTKQLNKHQLNLERQTRQGAPQEVIDNIQNKIGYYQEAIEALKGCD